MTATKPDIATMKAGPEMDALVAERVMGCPPPWEHEMHTSEDSYYDFCLRCRAKGPDVYGWEGPAEKECPRAKFYSTDIEPAWQVVDKMLTKPHLYFKLHRWGDDVFVGMEGFENMQAVRLFGSAAEIPLLICRAALMALEKANG